VAAHVGVSAGRMLLPADAVHQRAAVVDDRAGRDLRAGPRGDDVPHAERGGRTGEQHGLRPRGVGVERIDQPRARHRAEDQGGRGVDQLDEPVRCRGRVRRLSRIGFRARRGTRGDVRVLRARPSFGYRRSGRRARRPRRIEVGAGRRCGAAAPPRRGAGRSRSRRAARRPHAEAVHRRQAGATRLRLLAPHHRRRRPRARRGRRRQPEGHPQRRRGGARRGRRLVEGDGARARADPLLHRRESECAGRRAVASARCARCRRRGGGRGHRTAAVHLRRVGRQVRRAGAPGAVARRRARDERADRRDRRRVPRGASAARLRLARGAGDLRGQYGGRDPVRARAPRRDRLLSGARDVRCSGRRDQRRHGSEGHARAHAGRARRRRRDVVLRAARGREGSGAGVGRKHEANLVRVRPSRLARRARGRGPRVPAPGDAGEEHLDPPRRAAARRPRRTDARRSSSIGGRRVEGWGAGTTARPPRCGSVRRPDSCRRRCRDRRSPCRGTGSTRSDDSSRC
jgi:hypothetical protein